MAAIPIRNVFFLLSYAWNLLEEAQELEIETEALPEVADLLSRLLVSGTQRLLRRGIDRNYIENADVLTTLRGRIDFGLSARRLLLTQGKAVCEYDEFLPDILHNRILKATIAALARSVDVAARQRSDLVCLLRRMEGISAITIREAHFAQVRLHRNNSHYRLLIQVCELVWRNLLTNESSGQVRFKDFLRDEKQMPLLFQAFVGNFYAKETAWQVNREERIKWDTPGPNPLLPEMHADAVLRSNNQMVIVECKYYHETLQSGWWTGKPKLRSSHLYQITTYLNNARATIDDERRLWGLLLYPTVGTTLDDIIAVGNATLRAATIDLDQPWEAIGARLKQLADFPSEVVHCHGESPPNRQ